MEVVKVEDLFVQLNGKLVLRDINLGIHEGSFVCIMGPNGAGKTTLLKTILGLIKPIRGKIQVFGVNPFRNRSKLKGLIGYVPQREDVNYDVPLLVKDVVLMGRTVKRGLGIFTREDVEIAKRMLDKVGLLDLWNEPFNHLSVGQQQRVLIARALAIEPRLLLLDEPFTGVDVTSKQLILDLLAELKRERVTIIMVTHDLSTLTDEIDEVILLNRRIITMGKPKDMLNYYVKVVI